MGHRVRPAETFGNVMKRGVRILRHVISLLILCGCLLVPAIAHDGDTPGETLKVSTFIAAPFAMEDKGKVTGFSMDLWHAIAAQMNVKYEITVAPNVQVLLDSVKSGDSDIGVGNISITAARGKVFDFSVPIYDGGLQVMTRNDANENIGFFISPFRSIFTWDVLKLLGLIVLLVVVPAHVIWLLERHRRETGIARTQRYYPGIFHSGYWAVATLATQAEEMPKSLGGRLFAIFWMFVGIVFVAYFTAQMTAHLTVQTLQGEIKGPEDLPGHKVATMTGSTSAMYLTGRGIKTQTFSHIEDAFIALDKRSADAVVFDSPVLLYYVATQGQGKARIVGPVFRKENYAIAFRANSPWRRPINEALLTLKENGTYNQLYNKWFSKTDTGDE
jgi:polar amino acid transport system substrate-binding protein